MSFSKRSSGRKDARKRLVARRFASRASRLAFFRKTRFCTFSGRFAKVKGRRLGLGWFCAAALRFI
eukprot:1194258-Prorocentrum_minimum.AAC.4